MIELKVDDGKCNLTADGSSSKLSYEIMMAAHSLTTTLAEVTGMSFEAAAIFVMQGNTYVHKQIEDSK